MLVTPRSLRRVYDLRETQTHTTYYDAEFCRENVKRRGSKMSGAPGPISLGGMSKITINFRGECRTPAKKSKSAIYNCPLTAVNDFPELNFVTP